MTPKVGTSARDPATDRVKNVELRVRPNMKRDNRQLEPRRERSDASCEGEFVTGHIQPSGAASALTRLMTSLLEQTQKTSASSTPSTRQTWPIELSKYTQSPGWSTTGS
jgi:hypothetical protein